MPADSVIRVSDIVRIITPSVVIRVGYPKIPADYKEEVLKNFGVYLDGIFPPGGLPFNAPSEHRQKIEKILAYMLAKKARFGGFERTVHEAERPALLQKIGRVAKVRTVRTGTYYAASGSGDDYEPGGLSGACSHRVATVYLNFPYDEVDIRSRHLEKVVEKVA